MHLEPKYHKTVLDNGIRVVSEEINYVRSVSIGVWVRSGSCFETPATNGTAHFIEHMLFKGTEKRSALDIAAEIDSVGGIMNAFTGKEWTSFYIKIPDYHLSLAVDLLADILQRSRFQSDEIVKEQSVILQEIGMVEDSPDEYIHDFFEEVFWNGHPLGFPILGTRERILSLSRDNLLSFYNTQYKGDNLVLAATGHLKHDSLLDLVGRAFGSMGKEAPETTIRQPQVISRTAVLPKDLEQVHMVIGTLAPSATDPKRYPCYLLNAVLGGSMSSRLFQEIREKRGLAYAIHSYLAPYGDTGLLGIYAGIGKDQFRIVVGLIEDALKQLCEESLTEKEIRAAKELIKGNFLLGMESTDNRMMRLAKNELVFNQYISPEDVIGRIEVVEPEDIRQLACEMFNPEILSIAAIGSVSEEEVSFTRRHS
jgi:predicted Zn-dependent peptidase